MRKEYSTLELIYELAKYIGSLPKASSSLGYGSTYLSDLKQRITNPKVKGYNPNYRFSLENLNKFKINIRNNLGIQAGEVINLIDLYSNNNTGLEEYSNQQYNKSLKAHFFNNINTLEKAYWLGFLYADGSVKEYYRKKPWYRILIELSIKDKDQLIRFCRTIGLNPSQYIKSRYREKKYKDEIRKYPMTYVHFRCKPMSKDLINLGFRGSKSYLKSLPSIFNNLNDQDKRKLFLAWLLGFYDGDGEMNNTRITSSSRQFLQEIKESLKIDFKIRLLYDIDKKSYLEGIVAKKPHWRLTLGISIFNEMMQNYKKSMPRKRR
ncbi:MAG: hypothetical protein KGD66_05405 [Candidatus Lokiarchaeota archaeon]|nr:hypothetical protein [Candidatus Lokiarchaeota archaeon]